MAHIAPANIIRPGIGTRQHREVETLQRLQAELSDDYTVFHSVHWTREFKGDTVYGEIDFAVVNRAGRVLVIEQKNGALEETDTGLIARYGDSGRNVSRQVHRSLDNLREKFKRQHPGQPPLDLEYLIYCPEHHVSAINATGLDADRVVDASARESLPARIASLLGPGDGRSGVRSDLIHDFFRQRFDLVPDVHAHISGQGRVFARLSGGLVTLLSGIEMTPLRLRVHGTAGCGKTMIARHFYDESISMGRRPLLVCFNRPLAERLKAVVQPGGLVTTWFGLCAKFLDERGRKPDYDAMRTNPGFWPRVLENVIDEPIPDSWKFDTIIVDEGQDFEAVWAEILWLFSRPSTDVVWLEDQDQNLRDHAPVSLPGFVRFRARVNYRSPRLVANFIRKALPSIVFEPGNDLPGLGVGVTPYDHPDEQCSSVSRIVAGLLHQGFKQHEIILLTTRGVTTTGVGRSIFSDAERVGNYRLRRFTGDYDLSGNQVFTQGQLIFESVGRFKGQESPAVILADMDAPGPPSVRDTRLVFSAMTRATVRLEMLVKRGSWPAEAIL